MKTDITAADVVRQQVQKDYLVLCHAARILDRPPPKLKEYVDENGCIEWILSCNLRSVLSYEFNPVQRKTESSE